jgi:RND family efflux transporter MFP subunit
MTLRTKLMLLGLPLALGACSEVASKEPEVRTVRTVVANPAPVADDRRAVGEVRPRDESELGFRVSGKVITRLVDVGASVRAGDTLARLDDQDYRNKLRSAEADLVSAQAVQVEAAAAEERYRTLLASGSTTRANYDTALKNLRSADAKLESAKANYDMAKDQLAYAELKAEFDGVITAVGADPGQVVNSGKMIVRLAQPDDKDAVFAIAESVFGNRKPSGNERPEIAVTLLSNSGISADGTVREISPIADPVTRTYQVKVTLKNAPEEMRFGGSVVGRLKTASGPVVVLPGSALFDKAGQPAVWVVDTQTGELGLKPVVIGRYETDRVIVSTGLVKGDIVVTAGVNRLRENQRVRLTEGGAQ